MLNDVVRLPRPTADHHCGMAAHCFILSPFRWRWHAIRSRSKGPHHLSRLPSPFTHVSGWVFLRRRLCYRSVVTDSPVLPLCLRLCLSPPLLPFPSFLCVCGPTLLCPRFAPARLPLLRLCLPSRPFLLLLCPCFAPAPPLLLFPSFLCASGPALLCFRSAPASPPSCLLFLRSRRGPPPLRPLSATAPRPCSFLPV